MSDDCGWLSRVALVNLDEEFATSTENICVVLGVSLRNETSRRQITFTLSCPSAFNEDFALSSNEMQRIVKLQKSAWKAKRGKIRSWVDGRVVRQWCESSWFKHPHDSANFRWSLLDTSLSTSHYPLNTKLSSKSSQIRQLSAFQMNKETQ